MTAFPQTCIVKASKGAIYGQLFYSLTTCTAEELIYYYVIVTATISMNNALVLTTHTR